MKQTTANIKFDVDDPDFKEFLGRKTVDGTAIDTIDQLCLYLVEEEGLALVPGSAFGTESHARISYAYSTADLEASLKRLQSGLGKLQ